MKKINVRGITFAGIVACLYTLLTIMPGLSVISFGAIQFRISEALTVLPIFSPWAIPGLTIGCMLSNLSSPMIALDLPLGSLATLLAAISTYFLRKKRLLALLPPAIFNGIIVGSIISFFYSDTVFSISLLFINMLTVAAGEIGVCYILGYPLSKILDKRSIKMP